MNTEAQIPHPLRQDLRLHESGPGRDGSPSWAIQDPVSNRFYRIGWLECECLLRWPGDPAQIAADIAATTPLAVDADQVTQFGEFLERHHLLVPTQRNFQRMIQQARQPGWRHWRWWLHHYLSIRLPLVRPERFLARLLPLVNPLFTPLALVLLICASLAGLLLTARQWETFTHSVQDMFSPEGLFGFALALIVSKTLHELGHALVATRLGVRVAHMGVTFIVLWPMLYTDTSESWRLRSHRQRLAISVAGISVEMALAGLALLAWALLDDGLMRQAALYLATTGWVLSLALNLSPFMRFDGYFILSDLIDFPNLHERAGAAARVWLRRRLLGLDDPYPEYHPVRVRRALVAFALLTWLYRFTVFLGIAWAVYAFSFKVLGIFLMGVEIMWFIVRPIWSEVSVWQSRWQAVTRGRRRRLWLAAGLGAALLCLPWHIDVQAPGVAHAEHQQLVYAPFPAMLNALHPAGGVQAGEVLAHFQAPDLEARELRAHAAADALARRLAGLLESSNGVDQQQALIQRLSEQLAEARAVQAEAGRLGIHAEFAGQWRDLDPLLRSGAWVGTREPVGVLIDPASWVVDAYVEQGLIEHIAPGDEADFLPEGSPFALAAKVVAVDTTRSQRLMHRMLDGRHGGPVATRPDGQDAVPTKALYRVRLQLAEAPPSQQQLRGVVRIQGRARSLAWEGIKGSIAALIRESGF